MIEWAVVPIGAEVPSGVFFDTLYVGNLKRVGKIWQYSAVDGACSFGFANVFAVGSSQLRPRGSSPPGSPPSPPKPGPPDERSAREIEKEVFNEGYKGRVSRHTFTA